MLFIVTEAVLYFSRDGWLSFEDLFDAASADYQVGFIGISSNRDNVFKKGTLLMWLLLPNCSLHIFGIEKISLTVLVIMFLFSL